jgi:phage terminase large subunit-like protein
MALKEDFLQRECAKAQEIPAMENGFRRLHLNQWTQQESRIIAMTSWDSCEVAIDWSEYDGRTCFAGLDLSSTRDVTAFVLAFPEDDGGVSVRPWFWIPEMNIDQRTGQDQRMVRNYADQGFIESTPGNEVDVIFLVERIMEICQNYDVRHLGYDPWNAVGVVQLLQSHGMPLHMLEKMNQGSSTNNEPFKRLLSWLGNGKYRHDGNAVLRWMAGNTSHREDANGNIRPDKGRSSDKIDGICAMLMACGLLINYGSEHGAYMEAGSGVVLF